MSIRPQTEKSWQAQVEQCLTLHGWRVYHTHNSRRSAKGWPDIAATCPRLRSTIFVELKTETGTPSDEQLAWLADLTASGEYARIWRPSDWAEVQRVARDGVRGRVHIVDDDGQSDSHTVGGAR